MKENNVGRNDVTFVLLRRELDEECGRNTGGRFAEC